MPDTGDMTCVPVADLRPDPAPRALHLAARVDRVCDRFEAAWGAGRRPRIEECLGDEAEPARSALLHELLESEWECRRRLGERPTAEEYRARFPEAAARIDAILGEGRGASGEAPPVGSTAVHFQVAPPAPHDRYVIRTFHARGGIGEIYRADDREIGREVALKRLRDRSSRQDRFLAEAQVTGQLEHPGIVPVHDVGTDAEGRPFYVMKFVHGRTLKEVIADYHASDRARAASRDVLRHRLLETFIALCQAVAYAHSRGVVHRDLKPENVMVGRFGETVVLDWGLAKVMGHPYVRGGAELVHLPSSGGSSPTVAGVYMGSPPYMSPELAEGHADDADERTDVYLLGATLYEILAARPPRQGSSRDEIIEMARTVDPVPPRQVKPDVPRALEAICLKAMSRRKQDRYPGAATLAEEVQRHLAGEPVSAYPEGPLARAWRWCRRHRRAVERAAAAALVLAVAALAVPALRRSELRRAEAEADAGLVRRRERARADVAEFRRLSDQAHFFAASTLPDDEHAPYYDARQSESKAGAALAKADGWGPDLAGLPLADERGTLKAELYDLLLILAQTRLRGRPSEPETAGEALSLLDRAQRLRAPTRACHRIRSACSEVLGDRATAERERRRADDPRTPAIALDHFLLGESLRTQSGPRDELSGVAPDRDRLERAVEAYRQALELDPDHYWSRFQLSRCYVGLGRGAEAVEALGACVALRPDSPWGYSARGLALALQGRFPEALRDLDRAIALDSRPARLNRGVVFLLQKKPDLALADFEAALRPPDDRRLIEAAYYRGLVRLGRGDDREAEEEFDRVVAVNPGFRPAYLARARVRYLRGDEPRGRDDIDRYLSLTRGAAFDVGGPEASRLRGHLLRMLVLKAPGPKKKALGQWAAAELQRAIRLGDRSPALYQDLGALREQLGHPDQAIAAYDSALAIAPEAAQARVMRGWAYVGLGKLDRAQADFSETIRRDPDHAEAHCGLGFVRARQNANGEAQREAIQAVLLRDKIHRADDYGIFHNVACIYAELARSDAGHATPYQDQAIDLLRRALELWRRRGDGPDEIELIKGESAFDPALRARPEFRALIGARP